MLCLAFYLECNEGNDYNDEKETIIECFSNFNCYIIECMCIYKNRCREGGICAGVDNTMVITPDKSLYVWGNNFFGQLGNGKVEKFLGDINALSNSMDNTPQKIMSDVSYVSTSGGSTAAIKSDGTLWTWGSNQWDQLGNNSQNNAFCKSLTNEDIPIQTIPMVILENVRMVSMGVYHSVAIKNDNTLWVWGANEYGQFGNGTTENSSVPIQVLDNVSLAAAGVDCTLIVKTDGSLWSCGKNDKGQLGIGNNNNSPNFSKVSDDVIYVTSNYDRSMAIKTDGSLWRWGEAEFNNDNITNIPTKEMESVTFVSLGAAHTAVIKKDGSLWLWGNNQYGQLGISDSTILTIDEPQKIMNDVVGVGTGLQHTIIQKKDKSYWGWGHCNGRQTSTEDNIYKPIRLNIP